MTPVASTEELARAKINLSLKVLGRRGDGYHELQSLVVFVDVGDRVTAMPAAEFSMALEGPFASALTEDGDNLVLRAARLLGGEMGRAGAHVALCKNLPVASGIGGGSAAAAATLRALARLWGVRIEEHMPAALAFTLGADVPVCLDSRPAFMWARGERVARIAGLPHFALLLVNPGVAVSTAAVFKALGAPALAEMPTVVERPAFASLDVLLEWLTVNGNDLEAPARSVVPAIGDVLAAIAATKGCRLARMSGSGATCFGIYATEDEARAAADAVERPGWWVAASAVAS